MTQTMTSVDDKQKHRALYTPIDPLIRWFAAKVGGNKAKEVERFIKFAAIGFLGAVIDLGVSTALMSTILPPIEGMQGTINVLIAATISFICAVLSNFTWNRYWTYPDSRSIPLKVQLAQFATVSTIGWTARTIWITLSKGTFTNFAENMVARYELSLTELQAAQVGATLAIFFGIFVIMIWNFFVNRYWTYSDVD